MLAPDGRSRVWPVLGAALVVLAFWWFQLVLPAHKWSSRTTDLWLFFLPAYRALFARVANGELPLWNPYQLCGLPWLGSPQGGLFYPPHLLYAVLPVQTALALLGVGHLLLVAVTTVVLARRLGLGSIAALLTALIFTLGGAVRTWFLAPPLLEAASWLSLGAIAVADLARRPTPRATAWLAIAAAASWLAGSPQQTIYLHYAWATLLPAALAASGAPLSGWVRAAGAFAAAVVVGGLVAGVNLAPAVEMAAQGTRAVASLDVAKLFPLGRPNETLSSFALHELFDAARYPLGEIALVVVTPFVAGRRALVCWSWLLGGLALAVSIGPSSPLFPMLYVVPGLAWFRTPLFLRFLTDFCFAIAAGLALDAVCRGDEDGANHRVVDWAFLAAAVGFGVARTPAQVVVPALVGLGAVLAVTSSSRLRNVGAFAVLAAAASELWVGGVNSAALPYGQGAMAYDHARLAYDQLRDAAGSGRAWIVQGLIIPPELAPKNASFFRVRSIDDYESITARRQAEYFTYALEGTLVPAHRQSIYAGMLTSGIALRGPEQLASRRRLLDLASVRAVMGPAALVSTPALRGVMSELRALPVPGPDLALFENPNAVPRAYVTYRAVAALPPISVLATISRSGYDPLAATFVEGSPLGAPGAPRGHAAAIVRDEPEDVEIDATLEAPGLVVLADTFYPGWRATVDGAVTPILAANHLFRAVRVDAGTHRVRFVYRPRSVAIGAAATAFGLGVLASLVVAAARARGSGAR